MNVWEYVVGLDCVSILMIWFNYLCDYIWCWVLLNGEIFLWLKKKCRLIKYFGIKDVFDCNWMFIVMILVGGLYIF